MAAAEAVEAAAEAEKAEKAADKVAVVDLLVAVAAAMRAMLRLLLLLQPPLQPLLLSQLQPLFEAMCTHFLLRPSFYLATTAHVHHGQESNQEVQQGSTPPSMAAAFELQSSAVVKCARNAASYLRCLQQQMPRV